MDRDYLDRQYRQAVLEYRTARTEDEQWRARKTMARLERTAAELYGYDYADQLHRYCDQLQA